MAYSRLASAKALAFCALALGLLGLAGGVVQPAHADDSCVWAFDGECDDPSVGGTGACFIGTDDSDCGLSSGGGGGGGGLFNPCPFTNDGQCDEPNGLNLCDWGTDFNDCNPTSTGGGGGGLFNPCPFTNDGQCDEPDGLNLCDWGTDFNDCNRPTTGGGGGFSPVPPQQPVAPRPGIPSTAEGRQIQTALNYFGFNAGVVDGQIGQGTMAAIRTFQSTMGFPATGSLAPDQLGLLLGAYTWATTQGGAAQTGLGGVPLLQAYRTRLAAPVAPVAPPVAAVPQTIAPVAPVAPQRPGRPGGVTGNFAGLTASGNPPSCPAPTNSDGFTIAYAGYQSEFLLNDDGDVETWTSAFDGSFNYDTLSNTMGMTLGGWDVDAQGNQVPGTIYSHAYTGPAVPPMQVGSLWQGTEVVTYGNGLQSAVTSVRAEIIDQVPVDIGPCSYQALRGVVTRTDPAVGIADDEYYLHFPEFGLSVYVGYAATPNQVEGDDPVSISIRADDGFGPSIGAAGVVSRPRR